MTPVTLITGASAGLGAEFASQCAARGEQLVLVARRRDRLEELAATLPGKVHVRQADLAAPGAALDLIDALEGDGLQVDTLINNAGFGQWSDFAAQAPERQQEMVDLNVSALLALTRRALTPMLDRRRGAILNVASIAGFFPGPGSAVYSASKAFVLSLTEALHQEVKGAGIRVTALCPGPVRTEFADVAGIEGAAFDRMAADAPSVVRAGLKGLDRNKAVVIPGAFPKFAALGPRLLSRGAMRRAVGRVKLSDR